jgi:quercetin dioxygenase-like cupin family protein
MTRITLAALALTAGLIATPAFADEHKHADEGQKVTPKLVKELSDIPGKEAMVLTVELAPGYVSKAHRHDAHTFVYMLEGEVDMQVAGGPLTHLKPGDTFYENPADVHTVATNTSSSNSAKFLVVFVKNKGAPPVLPAK